MQIHIQFRNYWQLVHGCLVRESRLVSFMDLASGCCPCCAGYEPYKYVHMNQTLQVIKKERKKENKKIEKKKEKCLIGKRERKRVIKRKIGDKYDQNTHFLI